MSVSGKATNINSHIVKVPASLGRRVELSFRAGEFKAFGDSERAQLRGKEGVLWLLSTIYCRNLSRRKGITSPVPLANEAMEKRYGKGNAVSWSKLKRFCESPKRAFILDDGFYREGKCYQYHLNPAHIEGVDEYYYRLQEQVIINKRLAEIKRFSLQRARRANGIDREAGRVATIENLGKLSFDRGKLDEVCRLTLNISLEELTGWADKLETSRGGCFMVSYSSGTTESAVNIMGTDSLLGEMGSALVGTVGECGGGDEVRETLFIPHSVPLFHPKGTSPHPKGISHSEVSRQCQLVHSLTSLYLGLEEKVVFTDDKGGRLYSPITNLKREARKALVYRNGEEAPVSLVNLDIKTCQPWILGVTILNDYQEQGMTPPPDLLEYLDLVEGADLYNAIVESTGQCASPESRDKVKKKVMQDIYRSRYINKKSSVVSVAPLTEAGTFIEYRFPSVWQWIQFNKGDGRKSKVPIMMQRLEADFFIENVLPELKEKGIWCLTIHDSVIVRADYAEYVKSHLERSMLEFFGRYPKVCMEDYRDAEELQIAA